MLFDPVAFFIDDQKHLVGGDWAVVGTTLELSSYIELAGVTTPEVQLLATADLYVADARVMLQVQKTAGPGPLRPLYRIEWRPKAGHTNRKVGPRRLHYREMPGSHAHRFLDNWVAAEGRMLTENLPVADHLPSEPQTFAELVAIAALEFRIPNMVDLPPPPWEPLLRID